MPVARPSAMLRSIDGRKGGREFNILFLPSSIDNRGGILYKVAMV